ncbi:MULTISPECIES: CAP domain-containing protein [Planktothricoides]|uniref:CAP domain-containing protein n=2 Tax=Planktothricoides raciborskii TaxID=132608 RepID=A0AAU8J7T9_9CYAN|nr:MULTISPECIES: CAP domain-containing protein [Planktothricoides]
MLPTKFLTIGSASILVMAVVNLLGQVSGERTLTVEASIQPARETITAPMKLAQSSNTNFSALEQAIIQETNAARTNPTAYAAKLEKQTKYFEGGILKIPGQTPLMTQEGVSAVNEAIQFLKSASPMSALTASSGMSKAAADHVQDQGPGGNLGHTGTDGSQPWDRLERYGEWQKTVGENISYGPNTGEDVVISLIVDDGVTDRGHRTNIFNSDFRVTGVACGEHREYRVMCVITYAGGYEEK